MNPASFLEAIRADPADDLPRMVYSDWLEEHDELDRAEFIRVQCELSRGVRDRGRALELLRRLRALILAHRAAWLGPLKALVPDAIFERGFVERIRISANLFLDHADGILTSHPICHVRMERAHRILADLLACPSLAALTTLDFQAEPLRDDGLMLLARCPSLVRLRSLDLSNTGCSAVGVGSLVAGGAVAGLTSLTLSHNRLGNGGVLALLHSPGLPALSRLDLSSTGLNAVGAALFVESPLFPELRFLRLQDNAIGLRAVERLGELIQAGKLEMLDVRSCGVNPRDASQLSRLYGAKILV